MENQFFGRGLDIDLNALPTYENPNQIPRFEIHQEVIEADADGGDDVDNNIGSDHEGQEFSDPDGDQVPNDIDEGDSDDDENMGAVSIINSGRGIIIRNDPGAHMSNVDPDAAHAWEFPEYVDIIPAYRLATDSESEELFVGQQFSNKEDCIFAIKRYSMKANIDYKVAKNKSTYYVGECWRSAEGCNWRVRAAFIQKSQLWEIRKFNGPHTCTSARMSQDHRKLDAKTICNHIKPLVKDMPTIPVSVLIAEMQERFQYRVSYRKAWNAKQMAMAQLYGDWDASYNELQGWITAMQQYVPGTIVELETLPSHSPSREIQPGKRVFHRMFWTFDPCVRAFPHCKPLVQVDGTWLYGKYTQILLIAVAQDGNRNVLPVAFAIVEGENMDSWEFFLRNLRRYVVREDNICIISDRSKGLIAAIRRSGVPWRSVYCIRHIAVNFHREFKNVEWRKALVNMGYEVESHRFRQRMARLQADMEGLENPSLQGFLRSMEPWQWAQSYDNGSRYGHMTTNLVEAINAVLKRTRHLPIASVFSTTFYRLATLMPKMGQRQQMQIAAGHVYVEEVRGAMEANAQKARSMNVELYSRELELFEVTEFVGRRPGIPPKSYTVDLRNRHCDCGKFHTLRYPCAHVIAACAHASIFVEQYIDEVYTLQRTLRIWGNEFPVLKDVSMWEVPPPTFEMVPNLGLRRRPTGRPQASRIRGDMDVRENQDPKRCGLCRTIGHSRNKCPHRLYYTGQSSQCNEN